MWITRTAAALLLTGALPLHALQAARDSTVVQGTVRGFDGRIPVRADVELRPIRAPQHAVRARVAFDGSFRIATAAAGPFRVRAAGVGYVGFERALPLDAPATVPVVITLAGYPAGLAKGPVIGVAPEADAEKPRPDMPPAVILAARGNGRRIGVLRAKRDTVAYRVIDITARLYLSPAGASAWRWAEDGEYDALTVGKAGADVPLIYDSTGVAFGGTSSLRVTADLPIAGVVSQLDSIFSFAARRRCLLDAQEKDGTTAFTATPAPLPLADQLRLVRQLLRSDARCERVAGLAQGVLQQFHPGSKLWDLDDVMQRRVILMAARHAAGQPSRTTPDAIAAVRARFDAAISAARDTTARFDLYVRAAETLMPADTLAAQAYAAKFVAESYDHPRALPLLKLTGYNRVLQPGRAVPAFTVEALDAGKPAITNAVLAGRVTLIDVWATWCIDCIVAMPSLQALQATYGPRGLQILSVSVDEQRATADRFRTSREQMPWMHAWAGAWPDGEGPLAAFEAAWLPTTILVGKDGRILAFAPKLDSAGFVALLEQALR
jgi:cytochrome c biogenesis protein CcmG/thiol:disulfide interchange protein DsbE